MWGQGARGGRRDIAVEHVAAKTVDRNLKDHLFAVFSNFPITDGTQYRKIPDTWTTAPVILPRSPARYTLPSCQNLHRNPPHAGADARHSFPLGPPVQSHHVPSGPDYTR